MQLSTERLNAFYAELLKGGLSPASVCRVHATVHRALRDAVRTGKLTQNPASVAELPKTRRHEMKTWAGEQVRMFLASVADERLASLWMVACTTGMRRGEILALRWSDLDLDAARAAVRRSLTPTSDGLVFEDPKTDRGRRSVAFDARTVEALREHRRRQLEERLAFGQGRLGHDDLVFANLAGTPIAPGGLSQQFAVRVKGAGLPPIRFHDLRHTHATLALEAVHRRSFRSV